MNGRAYGLDTVREGWRHLAACTPAVADLFTDWHTRDAAKAICAQCPVIDRCKDDAETALPDLRANTTAGGIWWNKHGQPERTTRRRSPVAHRGRCYGLKLCRQCNRQFSALSPNQQFCGAVCTGAAKRMRERAARSRRARAAS